MAAGRRPRTGRRHVRLRCFPPASDDPESGAWTHLQLAEDVGNPSWLTLDPSGSLLYAANQATHTIVTFRVDQETGTLTPTGQVIEAGSPVSIVFVGQ